MIEQLERVFEQIIIPQFEPLKYVGVTKMGLGEAWYKITYYFEPPLDREDAIKIMEETSSLYHMMGIKGGDIIVTFEKADNEVN